MVDTCKELTAIEQQMLLDLAEQCVRCGFVDGNWCDPHAEWYPHELRNIQACFVSLHSGDDLLGSIGTTEAKHPLVVEVARNAFDVASLVAHRKKLLPTAENNLMLEIAILTPLNFLSEQDLDGVASHLQPGREGVFIRRLDRAATFLPKMWEKHNNSTDFLRELCARATFESGHWPEGTQVATFTTQNFSRILDEPLRKSVPR